MTITAITNSNKPIIYNFWSNKWLDFCINLNGYYKVTTKYWWSRRFVDNRVWLSRYWIDSPNIKKAFKKGCKILNEKYLIVCLRFKRISLRKKTNSKSSTSWSTTSRPPSASSEPRRPSPRPRRRRRTRTIRMKTINRFFKSTIPMPTIDFWMRNWCHRSILTHLLTLKVCLMFFGYLSFSWMNQDWVQESILAWLWHHFHLVLRDLNPRSFDRESSLLPTIPDFSPWQKKFVGVFFWRLTGRP